MNLMISKVKKFFSLFLKNKKFILLSLFLGLILSAGFVFAADNPADIVLGAVLSPVSALIIGFIALLVLLTTGFASLSSIILGWVLNPNFINLSYTNPANNEIIKIGFGITQGIANIGIFLALVFIALSTILRIKDYQAQKTLPTLIIIAVLINFAPVIAGVIVDASNIAMAYLLDNATGVQVLTNRLSSLKDIVVSVFNPAFFKISNQITLLIEASALTLFSALTGFILLIFSFLFAVRYVAIWLLVILSPLAFIARILKDSKQYWDMWWQQLVQWSIIGVIGTFFLYIAEKIAILTSTTGAGKAFLNIPQGQIANGHNIIEQLFVMSVPLIFLFIGLMLSFQTSAMGANQVINWSKGAMATVEKRAGKFSWQQTGGKFLATEKGKRFSKRLTNIGYGVDDKGKFKSWKDSSGRQKAGIVAASPLRWVLRPAATAALRAGAGQSKGTEERIKKYKDLYGKDVERAASEYSTLSKTDFEGKIAIGRYLEETKGSKGLEQLREDQLREVVKLAAQYNPANLVDIIKYKPDLMEDEKIGKLLQEKMIKGGLEKGDKEDKDVQKLMKIGFNKKDALKNAIYKKAVDELKDADVPDLPADYYESNGSKMAEMVVRFKSPSFIRKIGEEKGQDCIDKIQNEFDRIGAKNIKETNSALIRQIITNPGMRAILKTPIEVENLRKPVLDSAGNPVLNKKGKPVMRNATPEEKIEHWTTM